MVHSGDIDWDRAVWWIAEVVSPSSFTEGELDKQQLVKLVVCLASQNQRLAQMKQEKLNQIEGMLKWTRRIALGAATGAIGWLVTNFLPALLKVLGL